MNLLSREAVAAQVAISVTTEAPQGYKDLVWDTFFKSRNRGISLETHFPLFANVGAFFVTIARHGDIVAGLTVKPVRRAAGGIAGLVGLVCVHLDERGLGLSTLALRTAIAHAEWLAMDDLILWTGKPGVYERLGFEVCDTASSGFVVAKAPTIGDPITATRADWPDGQEWRGLPPFATEAVRWESEGAAMIVLESATGPILAEWTGADDDVLRLIDKVMPDKWRINSLESDGLPAALEKSRWSVKLQPSGLQMIRKLRPREGSADPYKLRILDRI